VHVFILEVCNQLPPSNIIHAFVCIFIAFLSQCHKSYSNFLFIVDFCLSCSCYFCNNFQKNYYQGLLMYFILSCVLSCIVVIVIAILSFFSWNILSSRKWICKICTENMVYTRTMKSIVTLSQKKKHFSSCLVFFVGSFSSEIDASCVSFLFFTSGQ
jgi:Na+/phosphate symporter